jgi:hypothetical protein
MALELLFRPAQARPRPIADYDHAYRLVHTYGSDTLAYFALRDDKSYFFSSDGEAMIAYAFLGRYALASGDPIGRPESIDLVIREFLAMCRDQGWGTAFLAVRESEAARYSGLGLRSFYLGEEAVIECADFVLEGKRNKSMRQSVQRVARTHRFEIIAESDASAELVAQLNEVSRRWRGKAPERGFTMALGREVEGVNPEYLLCVAFDADGVPGGFLRLVPLFGGEPGMTLDLMRRDPESPNGMTEFLVANAIFALRAVGICRLSMNFALMGRLFTNELDLTRGERALKTVVSLGNPFFQIKSLHEFNRRFRPEWRPRVIVYEERWALPRIAVLYGGIEGFLALPLIGRYFVPQRFDHERVDGDVVEAPEVPERRHRRQRHRPPHRLVRRGRLLDVADEAVEMLEPHDVRGVAVDVEGGPGDPAGDELGVRGRDQAVLRAVRDERRDVEALERVVDAGVGGERLLGGILSAVDLLGEEQAVVGSDVDDVQHLLHVGVALRGARGCEGQVEQLVEVAGPVGRVGGAVGLNGGGPAGRGAGEHQRAGLARVVGGEGQRDLAAGRPPDDRRPRDAERLDERRQVVGHHPDGERLVGGIGAVADAPQVVHRDLVVGGEATRQLGAPHGHGRALPDDQHDGRAGPDLAVADGDPTGLHLSHRAEEGEVSAGKGAGDLHADHGRGRGLARSGSAVDGGEGVGGTRCVDGAGGVDHGDKGDGAQKRSQT